MMNLRSNPTRHHRRQAGLAVIAATCLLVGACGSSSDASGEAIDTGAPAATTTTESTTPGPQSEAPLADGPEDTDDNTETSDTASSETTTDTPEPAPEASPPPIPDAPALESIYQADPGPGGWSISAGEWISHSLTPPLAFTLPVDGTVISDTADAIEIAVGDPANPEGYIVISTPIALSRPTGPIPIDLVNPENALAGAEVIFEETGQGRAGDYTVRDVIMPDTPPFDQYARPCFRHGGRLCLDPLVTRAGFVYLETGIPQRFVTQDYGERGRLYIAVTAADPDNDEFRAIATDIAQSAQSAEGSSYEGTTWLHTIGNRATEIPAGTYVARVGETVLEFSFAELFDRVELPILTPHVVGLEATDGFGRIWITSFADFIDPATERARTDRTTDAPLPLALFEQELRDTLVVSDSGQAEIAGVEATWFDTTSDPEKGAPCAVIGWPTAQAGCQLWTSTPAVGWYMPSDVIARLYYLEAQDLLIFFSPWPGNTADEIIERFQPLLDGLRVVPTD